MPGRAAVKDPRMTESDRIPAPAPEARPARETTRIEVVTRGMLRAAGPLPWRDPFSIASIAPEKRRAMLANPLLTDDSAPVQLLGVRGSDIIGRLDLIHGVMNAEGAETPIAWGSEWYVPPEHRGSLVGVSLILKQAQLYPNIGASGPSQMAVPVYQKLKWGDIPLARWILIRRSRSVVERYLGAGPHSKLAALLVDIGLSAHRAALRLLWGGVARRWTCERVERFGPEIDPPLTHLAASAPVSGHRSSAWLNWLMSESFKTDPRSANIAHLIRDTSGKVAGLTISKVRFFPVATHRGFRNLLLGAVQEYASFDPALSDLDLLRLAVLHLDRHGVDAIEVSSEDPEAGRMLRRVGFLRVGSWHMMFKGSPKSPLSRPELTRPGSWRTRPIDGDNFFV